MAEVKNFIIADAEGLEDYDYACWTNTTVGGAKIKLVATFVPEEKILKISPYSGSTIPLYDMKSIYFGNSKSQKENLCAVLKPSPQHPKDVWKNKISSFLGLEPT